MLTRPVTSITHPKMVLEGGTCDERFITGALESTKNNAEVNLAMVMDLGTPHTSDMAFHDLQRKACKEILGGKPDVLLKDMPGNHKKQLMEYAISLFILKQKIGSDDNSSFEAACNKLKKAVQDYKEKGEAGYSSTGNIKKTNAPGFKADKAIRKEIDGLVSQCPDVFEAAAGRMHEMYLRDGLPKAEMLHRGMTSLDAQSMVNISVCGNASEAYNSKLTDSLNLDKGMGNGAGLVRFVRDMLGQLDQHRDPVAGNSTAPKAPTAGEQGDGRDSGQADGGPSISGITISPNISPNISSGGEGALLKTLEMLNEQNRFLREQNLSLRNELLRVHNPNQNNMRTDLSLNGGGILRAGSNPPLNRASVETQTDGTGSGQNNAETQTDEVDSGRNNAESAVLSWSKNGRSEFRDGTEVEDSRRLERRDLRSSSVGRESLGGGKTNTLELNPQLMPLEALRYFNIKTDGAPDFRTQAFFDQIASGIQSNKPDALALREYIKKRHDPSKARVDAIDKNEASIHRIYADAKKESPAFALRLEMLFSQFNERRVDILSQNHASTDSLKFELKPQLMPERAFRELGHTPDKTESFFEWIANGIQGNSDEAKKLKEYIASGRDPSRLRFGSISEPETKIFELYGLAIKESPAFGARIERLFAEWRRGYGQDTPTFDNKLSSPTKKDLELREHNLDIFRKPENSWNK